MNKSNNEKNNEDEPNDVIDPINKKKKFTLLCCSCCKLPPIAPPYNIDVESQSWIQIKGAFTQVHQRSQQKKSKSKSKSTSKSTNKYKHTALKGKYTTVRRTEMVRIASNLTTCILFTNQQNKSQYATLERTFYPSKSERSHKAIVNVLNPTIQYKLKFVDDTGAIDETVVVEFARKNKPKVWHANKIHTDLFVNGKKVLGLFISPSDLKLKLYPFLQTLSLSEDKDTSKGDANAGGANASAVQLTLVTYRGATFNRSKRNKYGQKLKEKDEEGNDVLVEGYKTDRIMHLFLGNIETVENVTLAEQEGRLIAILNEQNGTMYVLKKTITMDLSSSIRSLARRGVALMLLRRLGLEKFNDV